MANRRSGGMGGGPRGGRPFSQHQPFQGSGVSPWQGSPNSMNQGGLISQLTSNPQQLALALTNLLQPQQQMNNPPSLLSLNTSAFSNQNRDFDRFGNRGRDFRRHEPYNKNNRGGGGGAWRNDNRKRNQNKKRSPSRDQKKKEDAKKKDVSTDKATEDDKAEGAQTGDEEKDGKEGPYHGVPVKFLNCFVCNKEMWDGESMKKHVKGRAHRQMLDSLEESIHLTVNILREQMRLAEEKKVIEWNRMQRVTKKFSRSHEPESHCNMCDLKFMGKIVAHRKTEGHQRLKRYLHPNCTICDKEFPSRMDWVEHRLTPEHLRKLNESLEEKTGEAEGDVLVEETEPDLEPILNASLQMEAELPIFELTDDLTGLQNLIPAYKPDRAVSKLSLQPFAGFRCELCHRSFENEDLAQAHLKTRLHYHSFIEAAKNKYQQELKKKEKELEEQKKKEKEGEKAQENGDAEMYDPEEACNEDKEAKEEDEDAAMEVNEDGGDPSVANDSAEATEVIEDEPEVAKVKAEPEVKAEAAVKKETPPAATKPATSTPVRQTRTAAATPGGAVKKGAAGPKSKMARK